MKSFTEVECAMIYTEANRAGIEAGEKVGVVPMIVGTPTSLFANNIDTTKPVYLVNDGVCGFAWVNIKPARGAFVKYCKMNKLGRSDSYEGGFTIWCHAFNQSMTRKEAWAGAFVKVLNKYGIQASARSRMD